MGHRFNSCISSTYGGDHFYRDAFNHQELKEEEIEYLANRTLKESGLKNDDILDVSQTPEQVKYGIFVGKKKTGLQETVYIPPSLEDEIKKSC